MSNHPETTVRPGRRRALNGLAAAGLALALAACGQSASSSEPGDNGESGGSSTPRNQAAYDQLPESVRSADVINASSSFDYGPFAYIDEDGDQQGYDVDVVNEIGARLGVPVQWQQIGSFDSLIPAVQSGRVDLTVDGLGIISERLPAVSFVYEVNADIALLVQSGNPRDVDPNNLCGDNIATNVTSVQYILLQERSADCEAAGQDPIQFTLIEADAQAIAVQSGQVDASTVGLGSGRFTVASTGDTFEVTGPVDGGETPNGIVVANTDDGHALGQAFTTVMQTMIDDGTLQEIADRHGLSESVISQAMFVATDADLDALHDVME